VTALFEQDTFRPGNVGDENTAEVLRRGADSASGLVRPTNVILAALTTGGPRVVATFERALASGVTIRDVIDSINIINPPSVGPPRFDGRRARFAPETLAALARLEAELPSSDHGANGGRDNMALERLMACLLDNLDAEEMQALEILDAGQAAHLFAESVRIAKEPLLPLFDAASGRLRSEEFSEGAWAILEQAALRATDLGYDRLLPPHCLLALLAETEGVTEHLVRLQAQPDVGPGQVAQLIAERFRLGDRRTTVELTRDDTGEAMVDVLRGAQREAALWTAEKADTVHLLAGLLDHLSPRLESTLTRPPLSLDISRMRRQLLDHLREARTSTRREVAFRLPTGLLPSDDLTYRARTDGLRAALHVDSYIDTMTRALFRREQNHVLITGLRGVGKTSLVWELARRGANGDIDFLARKRVLWVDCATVSPAESREKLGAVLAHVAGRTDVIVCLDGLGTILRAESGGHHKVPLLAALKTSQIHLIGIISDSDFEDLFSSDYQLLEFFTRVQMAEPNAAQAVDIATQACGELAREFDLPIDPAAVQRAVRLCSDYILNERLPAKVIKVFRRACEDADYERRQVGRTITSLDPAVVTQVVADITGIPEETLAGSIGRVDYERELAASVAGQPQAVAIVAAQLEEIKTGLQEPGKPASVMLFAGLTGTGKTELAKTLARFYSSSKRLQTYTMANFTQPHTVSGIVGVPPGYVGHEQGGRLINDLNADPYCVFLLDEAEKAHPDVWKLFLNLFDEGWIVDQRAIKAFADRAIFVLTSNVGADLIARRHQEGASPADIAADVREELSKVVNEETRRAVFPPEFLARIRQIVVFNPLDEDALKAIARMAIGRIKDEWASKREKELIVPDTLLTYVAKQAHAADVRSGFKEGGRIVRKLIGDLITQKVVAEAKAHEEEFVRANIIELSFLPPGPPLPHDPAPAPKVVVSFRREPALTAAECAAHAVAELRQATVEAAEAGADLHQAAATCLRRLEQGISRARSEHHDEEADALTDAYRAAVDQLAEWARSGRDEAARIVESLASSIAGAAVAPPADEWLSEELADA